MFSAKQFALHVTCDIAIKNEMRKLFEDRDLIVEEINEYTTEGMKDGVDQSFMQSCVDDAKERLAENFIKFINLSNKLDSDIL